MTKGEFHRWWNALEEVLMDYEPFSDSEGQIFWIDWLNIVIEQYRAIPGPCECEAA